MNAPAPSGHKAPAAEPYPRRWAALFVLLISSFMNLVDVTIVNVALPSMQEDLNATSADIEWVVAIYILCFSLCLLPFGRLGDVVGRRRLFLVGVGSFTLASALCGLAPSVGMLILARGVQGIGGAMMTPQVLAIATVMFPPAERGKAFSLFGFTAGLAAVTGPLVGGVLIGMDLFDLSWRPIFLINIPIGLGAIVLARMIIPDLPGGADMKNDFVGMALAAATVFCMIFPLIEGREFGWPLWCFAMMALSVLLLVVFFAWQRRQNAAGKPQLLPVSLFANGNFAVGSILSLIFFSGVPGFFLVLAIFLQVGFGLTPLQSGLTTVPFSAGVLCSSLISSRFAGRLPRPRITAGAAMLFVGVLWLRFVAGATGDEINHWQYLPPLLLAGIGLGTGISPLFQLVMMGIDPRDAGSGSGALQSLQQMGGALGVAIISGIFFAVLTRNLGAGQPQHTAYIGALNMAVVYNLVAFGSVALGALLLKATPPGGYAAQGRPAASQNARE